MNSPIVAARAHRDVAAKPVNVAGWAAKALAARLAMVGRVGHAGTLHLGAPHHKCSAYTTPLWAAQARSRSAGSLNMLRQMTVLRVTSGCSVGTGEPAVSTVAFDQTPVPQYSVRSYGAVHPGLLGVPITRASQTIHG